jgi:hypothetical protein
MDTQHQHQHLPLGHCRAQHEALYTDLLPIAHDSNITLAPPQAQVQCGHCRAQRCDLYTTELPRQTLEEAAGDDEDKWECADGEIGRWKVVVEEEDTKDTKDTKG